MSGTAWLAAALALAFAGAGAANLGGFASVRADFLRWGYPAGFHRLVGGAELAGAAMLLHPAARPAGAILLGVIMTAAVATLLRHRGGRGHLAAAALLALGLVGVIASA